MSAVTTCRKCGALYEESSEEQANAPGRECLACWRMKSDDLDPSRGILVALAIMSLLLIGGLALYGAFKVMT